MSYTNAPIIVLGMPCSGATLLEDILEVCGVEHVDKGIVDKVHKDAQMVSGCDKTGILSVPAPQDAKTFFPYGKINKWKSLMERERPWCFYDPRTLLYIDAWHMLFPDARFMLVIRHPTSVAPAMKANFGVPTGSGNEAWFNYHRGRVDHFLQSNKFVIFDFERLWKDPALVPAFFKAKEPSGDFFGIQPSPTAFEGVVALVNRFHDMHPPTTEGLPPALQTLWNTLKTRAFEHG